MIVVATDAPIRGQACQRLAARAGFGLGRTGSSYSNGSGDSGIAFSTATGVRVKFGQLQPRMVEELPTDATSPVFQAVLEAIPVDERKRILAKYRRGRLLLSEKS